MTKKKLAIAVIHGMGSQGSKWSGNSSKLTFSKKLSGRISKIIGEDRFEESIAWREIFWSDILQTRQEEYLKSIKRKTRADDIRRFVLCNLSDVAAYKKTDTDDDDTYKLIHKRVQSTITDLENECDPGAPLIVMAHSLGGHIMSNYIYDTQKAAFLAQQAGDQSLSDFHNLKTMGGFLTFGCNIPLFTLAYPEDKVEPIRFPGTELPAEKQLNPWWLNFYDKDDALGFPLGQTGPKYQAMIDNGTLQDRPMNAGNFFVSRSIFSHNAYWNDDEFYEPAAKFIKKFL